MSDLSMTYDKTKTIKKRPFVAEEIIDTLISEPLNVDINDIAQTPVAVIVNLPKEEYVKKRIGNAILRKFEAYTLCKDTMLIIRSNDETDEL